MVRFRRMVPVACLLGCGASSPPPSGPSPVVVAPAAKPAAGHPTPERVETPGPGPDDTDRDRDGIADIDDACPEDPELINDHEDHDGCPDKGPSGIELVGPVLVLPGEIRFEAGTAEMHPESLPLLQLVARVLSRNPHLGKLRVEAHTDPRGSSDYNRALSQARANAVRDELVRAGVTSDRVEAVGMGEDQPIVCDTCPPGDSSRSRRIELRFETRRPER